ncbi:L-type lectin-domain containing receptor kinase SIT2-like [Phragmites australis]|uniref:L-type lectin-domain containing receptor kinase SIT2-like n=1 Tax=Phragmites australis TaxID=29695 RepID=UPI002D79D6D6|nr:L-type lectin-domain containing receptor kinase SIT2-like [Phragmites australis]
MEHLPVSFLVPFLLLCLSLNLLHFCVAGDEQFVFSGFAGANLTIDGTATVTTEGILELTNNEAHVKGHAFHRAPLQFKESHNGTVQSFSATFVFAIVPGHPYRISTDGMAFLVSPTTDFSDAAPAQYMGFLNSAEINRTFAVELDTVQNTELQDIDGNHVGIHIASLYSLKSHAAGFYDDNDCTFKNLSLDSGKAMQVWVDYDGKAKQINVTLAPMGVAKPSTPLLSNISDLSTVLTEQAYVGFSAATGPIMSRYCVLAWSFAMNGPAPAIDFKKMPKLPNSGHKILSKVLVIALPIAAFALIFATCIVVILLVRRQLRYAELREDWEVEFGPHRFSYKDLFNATQGFKNKNIIGVGGFGKVYKGVLPKSKSEVAVKRVSHDSSQGIKEFISEVVSIGHLRHRNLVQLLGYCRRKGELLLVYDYMPNGSLDKYLYGKEGKPILEWAQRFQIIKDVASGLFYLHEKWEQVVIHRDIKASNVLLDAGMNAHLGDFGLARLYDHGTDLRTTHVVGTMGYIAPELARSGKASPLTDVFAFGTFLLEVTCGRQPVSNSVQHGRKMLVDRVLEYWHRGALAETVDSRLQGNYNSDEVCMVLTLGLMCSHPFPSERPTMRQVMQYLDGDAPLPELTPGNMSLLSMMQNEGSFDQSVLQYPWSGTSMGTTTTPGIPVGR